MLNESKPHNVAGSVPGMPKGGGAASTKPGEYYSDDDSGGSDSDSQKKCGNFFFKSKKYQKAITHFTKAIAISDERSNVRSEKISRYYSNRAMCENAMEAYRNAVNDAQSALVKDPLNTKGYYHCCKAYFSLQQYEDCLSWAVKGKQELTDEIEKIEKGENALLLLTEDEKAGKIQLLTEGLKSLKEWQTKAEGKIQAKLKAQQELNVQAAKQPEGTSLKWQLVEEGKKLYKKGDIAGAIKKFEGCLLETMKKTGSTTIEKGSSSGGSLSSQSTAGSTVSSESMRINEVKEDTSDQGVKEGDGSSGEETEKPRSPRSNECEANNAGENGKVIDLKPDLEAYEWMGKCFMRVSRPKEAMDAFKTQLKLQLQLEESSHSVDNQTALQCRNDIAKTYSNIGICAKNCGELDFAEDSLKKALIKSTNGNELAVDTIMGAQILQNLGQVYVKRADLPKARDAYQRSLSIYQTHYGSDHASVALAYLCLARLPIVVPGREEKESQEERKLSEDEQQREISERIGKYDNVLKILNIDGQGRNGEDKTKLAKILQEMPELPSVERFKYFLEQIKRERDALLKMRDSGSQK